MSLYFGHRFGIDQWPHIDVLFKAIANSESFGALREAFRESVINAGLHIYPIGADASLACGAKLQAGGRTSHETLAASVIMHRIWVDGTEFRWTREAVAA
jgi:hypothetical protein